MGELSRKDVYQTMRELEWYECSVNGDGQINKLLNQDAFFSAWLLDKIEDFVDHVAKNASPLMDFLGRSFGRVNKVLSDAYRQMPSFLKLYDEKAVYRSRVNLFFKTVNELGWPSIFCASASVYVTSEYTQGEYFNKLIARIHEEVNGRAFREHERLANLKFDRQARFYMDYVDWLFEKKRSRLLVVRIDLRYRAEVIRGQSYMLERFRSDLEKFSHAMSASRGYKQFKDLVGFIRAIEFGMISGHHAHFLLFFDGSKRCRDGYIAEEIGKLWLKITNNDGAWFSTNLHKKSRNRPDYVLGMINRSDLAKRAILNNKVVKYFFKRSQVLRYRLSPGMKHFTRGDWIRDAGY